MKAMEPVATEMYSSAQANQQAGAGAGNAGTSGNDGNSGHAGTSGDTKKGGDDVVDADFTMK